MKLLPRIAKGDLHALEQLYTQQKTKIYRLVLSMTADPYLAEDLVQETFLRVQERAGMYRNELSEGAWIVTIARNLAYDYLRRSRHEIVNEQAVTLEAYASADTDEQSDLMFLDLVKDLSETEKEIVSLRILASLSWREIGKITGQSADSCRKRYTRSLEKLRSRL